MEPLNYYLRDPAPMAAMVMKAYNVWLNVPDEKLSELIEIMNVVQENVLL
jgi:hypothetical protein